MREVFPPIIKLCVRTKEQEQIEIFSEHPKMNVGMICIIRKMFVNAKDLPPLF